MDNPDEKLTPKQILEKHGFKGDISKINDKKYNKWCKTKFLPPVPGDTKEWNEIEKILMRKDLSKFEKLVLYIHSRTNCDGIELSVFSDCNIGKTTIFNNGLILIPCFYANLDGKSLHDSDTIKSLNQIENSRFEYDGWIPIETYDEKGIRKAIRNVDEIFSVISMLTSRYFEWHPKYIEHVDQKSSTALNDNNIDLIKKYSDQINTFPENDRLAIYRSLGWFYQSFNTKDPVSQFFFRILSIESLVHHIENSSKTIFEPFKLEKISKDKKIENTNQCIEKVLSKLYEENHIEAIEKSYFDCVKGIRRKLKAHLEKLFGENSDSIKILFESKDGQPPLYDDIRHSIAHGGLDALSEQQKDTIRNRLYDLEKISRSYILSIVKGPSRF